MLNLVCGSLALLSLGITLWQWVAARRFALHQKPASPGSFGRGVTVLKPLKGIDGPTAQALESWFQQTYDGPYQILMGVASEDDPARTTVEQLIQKYPTVSARCIVCPEKLGPNAKVSTLVQLEAKARFDTLLISDADVWVERDFAQDFVQPLEDPGVGLVTAFYQLPYGGSIAMKWEALSVNADFWSQVLQAQTLKPIQFALGAAMLTTRPWLQQIGGLATLLPFLADDYRLGRLISGKGGRIALSPRVVECRSSPLTWAQIWHHQLRWIRTIRICQPLPFFFSILSNPLLWPLLWVIVRGEAIAWIFLGVALTARITSARANFQKLTQTTLPPADTWLIPFKDLMHVCLWVMAFTGNQIVWRGEQFRVQRDGKLAGPGGV